MTDRSWRLHEYLLVHGIFELIAGLPNSGAQANSFSKVILPHPHTCTVKTPLFKNYSLYTSWVEGAYRLPSEAITKGRVDYIELMANTRFSATKAFIDVSVNNIEEVKQYEKKHPPTAESIERWIQHRFDVDSEKPDKK